MSINIENYGEKLCVVKGNVYAYKDKLKELGCKWNPDLKLWYFPKTNIEKIKGYINSINGDESKIGNNEEKFTNKKDLITKKDFLSLLSRVERIEQLLALKKNNQGTIFEIEKQKNDDKEDKDDDKPLRLLRKKNEKKEENDNEPQRLLRKKKSSKSVDTNIIYTDGCCNKETKDVAWGSVVNDNKIDLIPIYKHLYTDLLYEENNTKVGIRTIIIAKSTNVSSQHNNYAELLSFVFALRIAKIDNVKEIKTDSELIFKYWSNPEHNTKLTDDENKNKYIQESKLLRKEFEMKGGLITRISGDENKADLGYHKG